MTDIPSPVQPEPSPKSPCSKKRIIIAVIVTFAALLIGLSIFLLVNHGGKKTASGSDEAMVKELHTFPPIEFKDSLYQKKVLELNEDETPKVVYYYEKDSLGQPTGIKVHETYLYPGNKTYIEGNVVQEKRDGLWYAYYPDGTVQTMAHYVQGKQHGQYTVYYENGNVRYTGKYDMGKRVGKWNFYEEDGRLSQVMDFDTVQ